MKAALGNPTADMESGAAASRGTGYKLHSRRFEGVLFI
jgi:hypothetical protein